MAHALVAAEGVEGLEIPVSDLPQDPPEMAAQRRNGVGRAPAPGPVRDVERQPVAVDPRRPDRLGAGHVARHVLGTHPSPVREEERHGRDATAESTGSATRNRMREKTDDPRRAGPWSRVR